MPYNRGRTRQSLRLRPVNTRKEIIDSTLLGVAAGIKSTIDLVTVVNDYDGTVGTVVVGSTVGSIYLFVQINCETTSANVDWYIRKNPASQFAAGVPTPGATGGITTRRFIFHEEKGIPGSTSQGQSPLTFRGVIKLPPRFKRMGESDKIQLVLTAAVAHDICVKAIYKPLM